MDNTGWKHQDATRYKKALKDEWTWYTLPKTINVGDVVDLDFTTALKSGWYIASLKVTQNGSTEDITKSKRFTAQGDFSIRFVLKEKEAPVKANVYYSNIDDNGSQTGIASVSLVGNPNEAKVVFGEYNTDITGLESGKEYTLNVIAKEGFSITRIDVGGQDLDLNNPTFIAKSIKKRPMRIFIYFKENATGYNVVSQVTGDQSMLATVEYDGVVNGRAERGSEVTLRVRADMMPFEFAVKIDGKEVKAPTILALGEAYEYRFVVRKDVAVEVIANLGVSITYQPAQHGKVEFVGATIEGEFISYAHRKDVVIRAIPDEGYKLGTIKVKPNSKKAYKDITSNPTFVAVEKEYEVKVEFVKKAPDKVYHSVMTNVGGAYAGDLDVSVEGLKEGRAEAGTTIKLKLGPAKRPMEVSAKLNRQMLQLPVLINQGEVINKELLVDKDLQISIDTREPVRIFYNGDQAVNGKVSFVKALNYGKSILYAHGDEVEVKAVPNNGYSLGAIKIKGSSENRYRDITANPKFKATDDSYDVAVRFDKVEVLHKVSLKTSGAKAKALNTQLNGTKDGKAGAGTNVQAVVMANDVVEFTMNVNGKAMGRTRLLSKGEQVTESVRINGATEIQAVANKPVEVRLEGGASNGRVRFANATVAGGISYYLHNAEVGVIADADGGYRVKSIKVKPAGGRYSDITSSAKFTASQDSYSVKVEFEKTVVKKRIHLPRNVQHGKIKFVGHKDGDEVIYGTRIQLEITPDKGYRLAYLRVAGRDISRDGSFVVGDNNNIEVGFEEIPVFFPVATSVTGNNTSAVSVEFEGLKDGQVKKNHYVAVNVRANEPVELSVKVDGELVLNSDFLLSAREYRKVLQVTKAMKIEVIVKKPVRVKFNQLSVRSGRVKFLDAVEQDEDYLYQHNKTIHIEAEPYRGYYLKSLRVREVGASDYKDITAEKSFLATADEYEVVVEFERIPLEYSLTASVEGDTKTGKPIIKFKGLNDNGKVLEGSTVEVSVERNGPHQYAVYVNGSQIKGYTLDETFTERITIDKDTEVVVRVKKCGVLYFDKSDYEAEGHKISVSNAVEFDGGYCFIVGKTLSINVEPAEGYYLKSLLRKGYNSVSASGTDITSERTAYRPRGAFHYLFFEFAPIVGRLRLPNVRGGKIRFVGHRNGEEVPYGKKIEIEVIPDEGYELESLVVGGKDITDTRYFIVGRHNNVQVSFRRISSVEKPKKVRLSLPKNLKHGRVMFLDYSDGAMVEVGTKVLLAVIPNKGYELESLTVAGLSIKYTKTFYAGENNKIEVSFRKLEAEKKRPEKKEPVDKKSDNKKDDKKKIDSDTRQISLPRNIQHGRIEFVGYEDGDYVPFGEEVEIRVIPDEGYKLELLIVGGISVKYSRSFIVGYDNDIEVSFIKMTAVAELDNTQCKVYPNPVANVLLVEGLGANEELCLINLAGKLVKKSQTDMLGKARINVTNLPIGMYILKSKQGFVKKIQIKH